MSSLNNCSRRKLLKTSGVLGAAVLSAGCNQNQDSENTAQTPTEELLELNAFELEVGKEEISVPSVWTSDNKIEKLQTAFTFNFETNQPVKPAILKNEEMWKEWDETETVSIQETLSPGLLQNGENTFTANLGQANQQVDGRQKAIQKNTPEDFLLDIQSANNRESAVFNTYSSHEQLSHDKKPVDLDALEEWHDNDYENLSETHQDMRIFVESLPEDTQYSGETQQKIQDAKNLAEGDEYPNSKGEENTWGHFNFEQFQNSQSAGEALDWLHPYLLGFEREFDGGSISTEDEQYAAVLQESIDRHTDIETHIWAFDLPIAARSTHGNGLVWDENNDELRILETIHGAHTAERNDPQLHPLIENSNYLDPDHSAYNSMWHPLRFDRTTPEREALEFGDGKSYASGILLGIATGFQDNDIEKTRAESGVGVTTQYVVDFVDTLKNYNDNSFNFEELKNQSKIYNKLITEDEDNYILGGTVENPVFAEVEDESKIGDIWSDQDGTLVDYVEELESTESN